MGKYDRLGTYLREQNKVLLPLTFAEIERIVGVKLPKSQEYQAWWSNSPSNNVMTQVWLDAGYRTEQVDTERRRLVFRKIAAPSELQESRPMFQHAPLTSPSGRHPIFGALKGSFVIQPGWDLTGPALGADDLRALNEAVQDTADLIERGLRD
jgi:hypothetical protein